MWGLERVLPVCLCYLRLSPKPAAKSLRLLKLSDSLSVSAGTAPRSAMTLHMKSFLERPFLNLSPCTHTFVSPSKLRKSMLKSPACSHCSFSIRHKVAPLFSVLPNPIVTAFTVHIIGCHLAKMYSFLRPFFCL